MDTPSDDRPSDDRILWQKDLAQRYQRSQLTIWRWKEAGRLPPPDVFIADRAGWYLGTIQKFEHSTRPDAA